MTRTNKNVHFNFNITFYIAESKEWTVYRKSNSLAVLADKARFQQRIKDLESILGPFLKGSMRKPNNMQ